MKTRTIIPVTILILMLAGATYLYAQNPRYQLPNGSGAYGGHHMAMPDGFQHDPGGNGGHMMPEGNAGGQGYGMMHGYGGQGGYGYGPQTGQESGRYANRYGSRSDAGIQSLREQIRQKRSELSVLYRSPNPDRRRINRTTAELFNLQNYLDEKLRQ